MYYVMYYFMYWVVLGKKPRQYKPETSSRIGPPYWSPRQIYLRNTMSIQKCPIHNTRNEGASCPLRVLCTWICIDRQFTIYANNTRVNTCLSIQRSEKVCVCVPPLNCVALVRRRFCIELELWSEFENVLKTQARTKIINTSCEGSDRRSREAIQTIQANTEVDPVLHLYYCCIAVVFHNTSIIHS